MPVGHGFKKMVNMLRDLPTQHTKTIVLSIEELALSIEERSVSFILSMECQEKWHGRTEHFVFFLFCILVVAKKYCVSRNFSVVAELRFL